MSSDEFGSAFDKIVMISGLSGLVDCLVSGSGKDRFFENNDFSEDDFFSNYITGSGWRGITREAYSIVYSCFGGEIGWSGCLIGPGILSYTLIVLPEVGT